MAYDNSFVSDKNDVKQPKREVHTCRNTPLKTWKAMVLKEYAAMGVDPSTVNELTTLHGWEDGHTPNSWADLMWRRGERRKNVVGSPPVDQNLR